MRETSSNRRRNRARHIAFEERDEAKLHRLSPQRHPQGRGQGGRVQGGETRPAARRSRRPLRGRRDGEQRSAMAAAPRARPSRTRGRAGPWRRARAAVRNPLLPPPFAAAAHARSALIRGSPVPPSPRRPPPTAPAPLEAIALPPCHRIEASDGRCGEGGREAGPAWIREGGRTGAASEGGRETEGAEAARIRGWRGPARSREKGSAPPPPPPPPRHHPASHAPASGGRGARPAARAWTAGRPPPPGPRPPRALTPRPPLQPPRARPAWGEAGAGHGRPACLGGGGRPGPEEEAAEDATPGPGGGPAREVGRRREEGATTARPAWRGRREPPPLVSSRPRLVLVSAARERNGRQLLLPLCVVGDDDFCRGMHLLFMRGKPSLPLQHAPPLLESV